MITDDNKPRTPAQNNALHLYCQLVAEALNDAGYDMKLTFEQIHAEIPWTKESVKEVIWKPIQKAMTTKVSTTELNTIEPSKVYEAINRILGERFGVHVTWPN